MCMQTIYSFNPWPTGKPGAKKRTKPVAKTAPTTVLRRRPGARTVRVKCGK